MPSTRRQKAKARKFREMDMMSDLDNLYVMLGNGNDIPIEKELADAIEQSPVYGDIEDNKHQRIDYRGFAYENDPSRQDDVRQFFEVFSNKFIFRLSQKMDSMMSMVHTQIHRAISTAISERGIPEIQNIVSSMSSSGNRDTETSMSPGSPENRENTSGMKSQLTKKDSRSACDLIDTAGRGPYMYLFVIGAMAKCVAAVLTYPLQLLQSRLRAQMKNNSNKDASNIDNDNQMRLSMTEYFLEFLRTQ